MLWAERPLLTLSFFRTWFLLLEKRKTLSSVMDRLQKREKECQNGNIVILVMDVIQILYRVSYVSMVYISLTVVSLRHSCHILSRVDGLHAISSGVFMSLTVVSLWHSCHVFMVYMLFPLVCLCHLLLCLSGTHVTSCHVFMVYMLFPLVCLCITSSCVFMVHISHPVVCLCCCCCCCITAVA